MKMSRKYNHAIRVRKDGAVSIPKYLRTMYGVRHNARYSLEIREDGTIILKPFITVCAVCGVRSSESLIVLGVDVCKACDHGLTAMVKRGVPLSAAIDAMRIKKASGGAKK